MEEDAEMELKEAASDETILDKTKSATRKYRNTLSHSQCHHKDELVPSDDNRWILSTQRRRFGTASACCTVKKLISCTSVCIQL